jgi:hypothetical protein
MEREMTIHKLSPDQIVLVLRWQYNDRRRAAKSDEINHLYDLTLETEDEARHYEIRGLQRGLLDDLRIIADRQAVLADEMVESGITMKKALAAYKLATP